MGWTSPRFPASIARSQRRKACRLNYSPSISGSARFTAMASTRWGVLSRKMSRARAARDDPGTGSETIAMEACASAHFWGRQLLADGRQVLLINPWFVKPFVKGSKNDATDAEAIHPKPLAPDDALRTGQNHRPTGFAIASSRAGAHRLRTNRAHQSYAGAAGRVRVHPTPRRMAISETGARRHRGRRTFQFTRGLFGDLLDELRTLDLRLDKLDQQFLKLCRTNEACRRLSKLPGVGPVIATALVAAVDDGRHLRSGRELAAWIGLVPRQYTTGGKPRARRNRSARQSLPPTSDDTQQLVAVLWLAGFGLALVVSGKFQVSWRCAVNASRSRARPSGPRPSGAGR